MVYGSDFFGCRRITAGCKIVAESYKVHVYLRDRVKFFFIVSDYQARKVYNFIYRK